MAAIDPDIKLPRGMTLEEALAFARGDNMEEFRKKRDFRESISREAEQYLQLPADRWPTLTFNWDESPDGQLFALDGMKEEEFRKYYPRGFRLGWTDFAEFDANFCHYSRRDTPEELWELGCEYKLAQVIAYVRRGLPITPPLVKPLEPKMKELFLGGGHHRYAAAKASGLTLLPILVEPEHCAAVSAIVPARWSDIES